MVDDAVKGGLSAQGQKFFLSRFCQREIVWDDVSLSMVEGLVDSLLRRHRLFTPQAAAKGRVPDASICSGMQLLKPVRVDRVGCWA